MQRGDIVDMIMDMLSAMKGVELTESEKAKLCRIKRHNQGVK